MSTPGTAVTAGPVSPGITTVTINVTCATGDVLFLAWQNDNSRTITGIADTGLNTWAICNAKVNTTVNGYDAQTWSAPVITGGSLTVTVISNLAPGNVYYALTAIPGLTASAKDKVQGAVATGAVTTVSTTSTGTLTQADELVMLFGVSDTASRPLTLQSGYTSLVSLRTNQFRLDYKNVAATTALVGTEDVTGGNADIVAQISTWKNAAAAGGFASPSLSDQWSRVVRT